MNLLLFWVEIVVLPILGIIVVSCIVWFVLVALFKSVRYESDSPWRKLAQENALSFSPRISVTGPLVWGIYRGFEIELAGLYTHRGSLRHSETKITFEIPSSSPRDNGINSALSVADIEALFKNDNFTYSITGHYRLQDYGEQIVYSQSGLEQKTDKLLFLLNRQSDLVNAYPMILNLGSQIMPTLQSTASARQSPFRHLANQLMEIIAQDTTRRLAGQLDSLVCPDCLTWFQDYEAAYELLRALRYYGCSNCQQSQRFIKADNIVAALDESMHVGYEVQNGSLRVNWLKQQRLFDFDMVEIVQASDQAVERFSMQVGNDTDTWRRNGYSQVPCIVSSTCGLSENTVRILDRIFDPVTQMEIT